MGPEASEEELKARATEALEQLALATGARGHIWMVIKGDGGKIGGCSPSLRPYGAALMDEVEKATEKPVVVTSKREPSVLFKAEKVLHTLAKTKHVELHPIVATLIQGLNEINNHKVPRVMALTDPSTMPKWFPFPPAVYAPRAQKMDLHQLFHVMDVIFNEVRGNLHSIQTLHGMLDRVYKTGSCSIGTRAGIDSFFEFLEDEALAKMGPGPKGAGGIKEEARDDDVIARGGDVIPAATNVASETSGVGAEEEPGRVRKRPRDESAPKILPGMLPTASPTNSTANSVQVSAAPLAEDEIDFEKHMSEEGGQYFAEFDALTQPQPFWDPALIPGGVDALAPDLSVAFEPHVQIDESAAQPAPWDFHSSGEFSHSGQSTLATGSDPMLHSDSAFQAGSGGNGLGGNGYNSTPTSSRNWTPDWYEDISVGGVYQTPAQHAPAQQVPGQQPPQNENLVRARLREQMELSERGLDTWTAAGGRNDTIPNPPLASEAPLGPPRLNKDDGLSESMRWDFLPQQQGAFTPGAAPGGQYGENAQFGRAGPVQPVMRAVGLAMARAPSFSPVQSFTDRAPPQAAPASQNPKPSGFLQKAKVLISPRSSGSPRASAPPKPVKARAAKAEAFPLARGALPVASAQPPPGGMIALPEERRNGEPEHLARWGSGDQTEGSLSGRQQSGGGLSSRQDSGGGSLSGWSESGGQDQESRSGDLSEKAHKILGIEAGRDPCVVGDLLERSGSLEEGDAGSGKKGLARFLPKLGRNKGKASERNANNKDVDDAGLRPGLYSDGSGEGLTPRASGEGFDSRQGVAGGLAIGGAFAPPPRGGGDLYAPLGAHPPEDCEAFPLARDVQRFDSFKSENSLTAVESESEELESFPVRRPAIERRGIPPEAIERRMQQLSVSESEEAVYTGPGPGQPAGGNAPPPRPEQAYGREETAPSPIGVGSAGVQRESVLTPKRILNGERLNGVRVQVNGGVPEGGPVEEDEDEERPGSPGFALGLGNDEEEIDFDDDTGAFQAGPVRPPASALHQTRAPNGTQPQVVSVRVVDGATGQKALSGVPVGRILAPANRTSGLQGPVKEVPVARRVEVSAARVNGPGDGLPGAVMKEGEEDDVLARLQRLRVQAST